MMADRSQQTEQPTERRLERARKEGNFPVSREFVAGLQFLAAAALLIRFSGQWLEALKQIARGLLARAFDGDVGPAAVARLYQDAVLPALLPALVGGALVVLASVGVQLATTRMGLAAAKLTPDFQRLNPLHRLRELPRQNLPQLMQALVLLPLFALAVWSVVRDRLAAWTALPLAGVEVSLAQVASTMKSLLWKAAGLFLLLGAVDLARQRRRWRRDLRMSKQEIREELKDLEGNPQVRGRIRRLQRDLLRRRMMSQIPGATAVIVNPTHFAVAIRYRMESMAAPQVVAKGKNYLALRIRELAVKNQVPVIENPPLAQALYKSVEVGQEIPAHLYRAVAEILAYIYRLMNGRLPG